MSDTELPFFEVEALNSLLEQEFDLLKAQDFESFEKIQSRKQELLNFLIDEIPGESDQRVEASKSAIAENEEIFPLPELSRPIDGSELLQLKLVAVPEKLIADT